jgi:hypothetical protein
MKLLEADQIWNRAALDSGGLVPLEGDRALADLLLAHGLIMNGGVEHGLQALTPNEFAAAIKGFRYFALNDVASLLEKSVDATENQLEQADDQYGKLLPDDETIAQRFEEFFHRNPKAFAPIVP